MVIRRRVGGEYGWDAGDKVCEDADFDAALDDGKFDVEGGDFVGQALVYDVSYCKLIGNLRKAHVTEAFEGPAGCAVHSESGRANVCRYNMSDVALWI